MIFKNQPTRRRVSEVKKYWHPMFVLGSLLVILTWFAACAKVISERQAAKDDAVSDLVNYSLLFKEDVLRRSLDLDRVLHFVRRSYERSGYHADWRALLAEEFTANAGTVQFAVIDRDGLMITSTALPAC
jgi:gamma-glutamyltranspeptidase